MFGTKKIQKLQKSIEDLTKKVDSLENEKIIMGGINSDILKDVVARVKVLEQPSVDERKPNAYAQTVSTAFEDLTDKEKDYLGRHSQTLVPIITKMVQTICASTRHVKTVEDLVMRDGMMRGLEYFANQSTAYAEEKNSVNPVTGQPLEESEE